MLEHCHKVLYTSKLIPVWKIRGRKKHRSIEKSHKEVDPKADKTNELHLEYKRSPWSKNANNKSSLIISLGKCLAQQMCC